MTKEKIIELAKELSAYDSNYDNYIMTEQDIYIFADELLKAINYTRCCKSDSEQLVCGCGKNKPVRREPAYLHCDWCGSITVETK